MAIFISTIIGVVGTVYIEVFLLIYYKIANECFVYNTIVVFM